MSEKSKPTGGKCVSENSTGGKSGATRTSNNPFEASRSEKPQYFVDVVKDKRTKNNNLEFLIGWRDFPNPIHDTWECLAPLIGSYDPGMVRMARQYLAAECLPLLCLLTDSSVVCDLCTD